MQLQESKVLQNQRRNPFKSNNDKEWWYTGISDEEQRIFLGISVIRTKLLDSIDISVYFADQKNQNITKTTGGHWEQTSFIGVLQCGKEKDRLDVSVNRGKTDKLFYFDYTDLQGDEKTSDEVKNIWDLSFSSNKKHCKMKGSFKITQQIPRFIKYDNFFVNEYTLLHYFQNQVSGTLTINDKEYRIENARGYQDHCFGTVPHNTKWHWIAVQGKDCALASLMNYGPYAQQYTEAFFGTENKNKWIRLSQDVSFEHYGDNRFQRTWKITSPDMDLECEFFSWNNQNNCIPPVIDLNHYEAYVKVYGRIRVDNMWKDTGDMYGVLEEHFGKW